jgi:hypothetical protein
MITEPKFWEDYINEIPCIIAVRNNWKVILSEIEEQLENTENKWLWNVPRVTVTMNDYKSPSNKEDVKLYTGSSWKMMGAGTDPRDTGFAGLGAEVARRVVALKTKMPYEEALKELQNSLPKIKSIFSEYIERGEMFNASLSVISPGTVINHHRGDPLMMRVHVGLKCDPNCSISVGNEDAGYESRIWEPGKVIAFKDGGQFSHSVCHNGDTDRWILLFDIPLEYIRTLLKHESL